MNPAESHFLLQTLYNMEMGLYDHLDPVLARTNPLAVVRAFPEEDVQQGSLIEELAFRYRKNRIHQRFDINFVDYMKLPCTLARKLDDVADKVIRPIEEAEAKLKADMLNNLDTD